MSLFLVFDPQLHSIGFSLNWLVLLIRPLFLFPAYWHKGFSKGVLLQTFLKKVSSELNRSLSPTTIKYNIRLPVGIFSAILIINFLGLMPYVFPSSGHLPLAVSLALPLWLGHMAYSWTMQPTFMLAHLVPTGSPAGLMPLIVIIELLRSVIRPVRLSVRLVANIVAGHLLMTLLRSSVNPETSIIVLTLVIFGLFLLRCLETAVALIQAYVFSILSTIYVREVNTPTLALGS